MTGASDIVSALGGHWHGNYGMIQCPAHDDGREPGLKVWDRDGHTYVNCFAGCDWRDVRAELTRLGLLDDGDHDREWRSPDPRIEAERRARERQERERKTESAQVVWKASRPAPDTLVDVYLRSRGITTPIPPSIRYHDALKHGPTGLLLPAMVAAVQDQDGKVTGVHRTFLKGDGGAKAGVLTPKMMLGVCAGGAVRLAKAGETLALAEGIETALSVHQATSIPTWATLSTSGLKSVILPPVVKEVIICADGDDAGEQAARQAAQRFIGADGCEVRIARAPKGYDFNDVLRWPEGKVIPFRGKETAHA